MRKALTNLKVWDGLSDGIDSGRDALVIEDGRIVELTSGDALSGFEKQDMGGLYCIPGLIDAHIHLCLDPAIRDPLEQDKAPAEQLLDDMRSRAKGMLLAGITSARDLGGGQWLELQLRDEIKRGESIGPRLVCSGQPITSVGGHCYFWGGEAQSDDQVMDVINRQLSHDVDLIKVMATGGNITKGSRPVDAQFGESTIRRIVASAAANDLHVAAHCHGTSGIKNAVFAGVKTIEHCSWVGEEGWGKAYDAEAAAEMAANDICVSPTINAGWKRFMENESHTELVRSNFRKLKEVGVTLIASTDAGIPNVFHADLPKALPVFAHYAELSPLETLRSATSDCAQAIGLGTITGSMTEGLAADFLLMEANPLVDLAALAGPISVYFGGVEVVE